MDRIVLNGESHLKYQTQALASEGNYFTEISDAERQQVAKDILCLLHILEPNHLSAHLAVSSQKGSGGNAISDIESWTNEIRGRHKCANTGK